MAVISMKELKFVFVGLLTICSITACNKKPGNVVALFYDDLSHNKFADAKAIALPTLQQQVDIIMHDKEALFNGQHWKYALGNEIIEQDSAKVPVVIKLHDGTTIQQTAKLYRSGGDWTMADVVNTHITFSKNANKNRSYSQYGNQMLISPLDIQYITPTNIDKHVGNFVLVTGHLCSFIEQKDLVIMTMGDNYEQKPLLKVILKGKALKRAVKDHYEFGLIDCMVKSPLGNTFTAVGLLKMSNAPYMKISNPQNIMIGPIARLE